MMGEYVRYVQVVGTTEATGCFGVGLVRLRLRG